MPRGTVAAAAGYTARLAVAGRATRASGDLAHGAPTMERRPHGGPTVATFESDLEHALESLREIDARGRLPNELRPLLLLAPSEGASVHVSLRQRESGRRIPRGAPGEAWSHRSSAAWIVFEVAQPGEAGAGDEDPMAEFLLALDHAERDPQLSFVSLKWFRDTYLAKRGYGWAYDPDIPRRLVQEATERDLILTSKVPNPKAPSFPVTSIRLNREHPDVRRVVGEEQGATSG